MRVLVAMAVCLLAVAAMAGEKQSEIFCKSGNIAVNGYDVVAYFDKGKAMKGRLSLKHQYKDAVWRFTSQENLDKFKKDPVKYVPQYGGYCAYGLAKGGYLVATVPDAFSVVDGKLYLNNSRGVQKRWEKKKARYIKDADKKWAGKFPAK